MEKNVVIELIEAIMSKRPHSKGIEIRGKTLAEKLTNLAEAIQVIDKEKK